MEIKRLRLERGLSQDELARRMGVQRPSVVQWEQNKNFPSTARLPELADILGCTIDALFGRDTSACA